MTHISIKTNKSLMTYNLNSNNVTSWTLTSTSLNNKWFLHNSCIKINLLSDMYLRIKLLLDPQHYMSYLKVETSLFLNYLTNILNVSNIKPATYHKVQCYLDKVRYQFLKRSFIPRTQVTRQSKHLPKTNFYKRKGRPWRLKNPIQLIGEWRIRVSCRYVEMQHLYRPMGITQGWKKEVRDR
jgi:hypothetical protein